MLQHLHRLPGLFQQPESTDQCLPVSVCVASFLDIEAVCMSFDPESKLKTSIMAAFLKAQLFMRVLVINIELRNWCLDRGCRHLSCISNKRETHLSAARHVSVCEKSQDDQLELPGESVVFQKVQIDFLQIFMSPSLSLLNRVLCSPSKCSFEKLPQSVVDT